MNSIQNSPDVLAALRQRKQAVRKELQASRLQMAETASQLTAPLPRATSRMQSVSRLVSGGFAAYQGFRFCTSIIAAIGSLFGRRRLRR